MDLHRLIVFCHVAAMIGLVAALVVEGISLTSLRRATSYEQAREWAGLWSVLVPLGLPSLLVVLASGIYLASTLAVWEFGWARAAIPTLVLVAVAGGIAGPRRSRLRAALATSAGPLPRDLRMQLRQPLFLASWRFRAALILGLVFDMTAKPDLGVVLLISAAALFGIVVSFPVWIAPASTSEVAR
jgi:hypothetical protein